MAAVLKDAAKPNLVQTLENNPVLIHGGPFANIAHGCNSVIATRAALALADYVVTEAGFGADLGAEKFLDIKCRQAGLKPELAVVVATVRALKLHGGADEKALDKEDLGAVERGLPNLLRHVENLAKFGLPVLVGINRFLSDTPAELKLIEDKCAAAGAKAYLCEHWAKGGAGAEALAKAVVATLDEGKAAFKPLYPDDLPLAQKIETVAKEIYRASGIAIAGTAQRRLKALEAAGYGKLPVCIAKTQYSFAADPDLRGAPTGPHAADPRGAPVGRGGVRGRHGRRHHEHARPAARAGGGAHRPDRRWRGRRNFLVWLEGVLLQFVERHDAQRCRMGGFEHDLRGGVAVERFLPAGGAQAPAVAGLQAGKAILRQGGAEIVAVGLGKGQERRGRDHADRVQADILGAGIAAAVAIEAGDRLDGAGLQRAAQDIDRRRAAGAAFLGGLIEHGPV